MTSSRARTLKYREETDERQELKVRINELSANWESFHIITTCKLD